MKSFTAYTKEGLAIITVFADNEEVACYRVEQELNKPGRGGYLKRWNDDGRIVRERSD